MQCARCESLATLSLGTEQLCASCHAAILAPIRERVLERDMLQETLDGSAVQAGPLRPDYGPLWAEVACAECGATWVGRIGDPCGWCQDRYQRIIDEQAALVLTPPDVDPDNRDRPKILTGWAERLTRAVDAGIVPVTEASRAYRKAMGHERAA